MAAMPSPATATIIVSRMLLCAAAVIVPRLLARTVSTTMADVVAVIIIALASMFATVIAVIGITARFFAAQHIAIHRFAVGFVILTAAEFTAAVVIAVVVIAFAGVIGVVFRQQITQQAAGCRAQQSRFQIIANHAAGHAAHRRTHDGTLGTVHSAIAIGLATNATAVNKPVKRVLIFIVSTPFWF